MNSKLRSVVLLIVMLFTMGLGAVPAVAATDSDSIVADTLRVSLITCDPGPDVYQLFGHTALRVQRSGAVPFDIVFNYGIFSFTDDFVLKFTKGETDYMLGVYDFDDFMIDYVFRQSSVVEQELNLTPSQRQYLLDRLVDNASPEHRIYRYNFLFNNCATRPRDLVKEVLLADGSDLQYTPQDSTRTFRQIIHHYGANYSWLLFGIDLALGKDLDRVATWEEQMFIPLILNEAYDNATIESNGEVQPIVRRECVLYDSGVVPVLPPTPWYLSPMFCAIVLLLIGVLITLYDIRKQRLSRWFDTILGVLCLLGSCIIYFLIFCSEHPATTFNINALWMTPLAIIPAFLPYIAVARKLVKVYHLFNMMLLALFLILALCGVQHINVAVFPLVMLLAMRSYNYINYYKCHFVK